MYTYSQLTFRNLLNTVALSIVFTAFAFSIAIYELEEQQAVQEKITANFFKNIPLENIENAAKDFNQINHLASLNITDNSATQLFNAKADLNWLAEILAPQVSKITLQPTKVNISLRINPNYQAKSLQLICLSMLMLSLLFSLIAGKMSLQRYKKIVISINQQIKDELSHVLTGTEKKPTQVMFDLPELNEGVAEIKAQINNHITDAGVLEKEAYIEPLTQLENRTRFVQFFENKNESIDFGVLTITRCSELQTINKIHGYTEGDNYICRVAEILKKSGEKYLSAKIFRLNSSDFATILPNTTLKEAEKFAEDLKSNFNEYQQSSDLDSVGYTGLVAFDKKNPLGELLALADTAISVAQTQQINAWYSQTDSSILESSSASYGNQNWRQEIESVLQNQRLTLLVQHIKPTSRNNKTYSEVLARFLNANNEILPTASFIAMAEKLDKIVEIDRMIIDKAITEISEKNLHSQSFGINVSSRTIHDEHFLIWLERRLLRDTAIASRLIFEITEYGLQQNIKTSKRFIDMIHRVGAKVTVERFGVGLTSFKFFRDLKPDFIKMDSTYTRDIDEDKNNQYFLRLMVDLAHRLSITVLAESVESQEEKFMLEKLFIDGCQGFYIGKPESI